MTTPDSIPSGGGATAAEAAAATVAAIKDNAQRLGLTWSLRPAIVTVNSPNVQAVYDGDSVAIAMTSTCGDVRAGQRVWVVMVPPSGNYIVGPIPRLPRLRLRNSAFVLIGGADQTISWTIPDEEIGSPWHATSLPISTLSVPEDGWYSIVASLNTDTQGVANSRQIISIEPSIGATGSNAGLGGYFYRAFWGIGETLGSVSTLIPLVTANTITVHARQNSAATMNANAVVVIAKVADL